MEKADRRYDVLIDADAHDSLQKHAEFLAKVSLPAAERLITKVYEDLNIVHVVNVVDCRMQT